MRRLGLKSVAAAVLACYAAIAGADDELVIYAFNNGLPATGTIVVLDGDQRRPIDETGAVDFDLSAGQHSVSLTKGGATLHTFQFTSAQGQLVDINVALSDSEEPQVSVETYFKTETARDRSQAPKGAVSGRITRGGETLSGAQVRVLGTDATAQTDPGGRYQLELARGIYEFEITHPDMPEAVTETVRVVSDIEKTENVRLGGTGTAGGPSLPGEIEEVVAVAKFQPTAFGESEQFSANVLETISLEQLSRFGDSDVAASVVRVPSVTVQDNRFVFIRGLGGRYVTTTLNGATLPSTDPTKREVPLDLFPSNIVKQLDVKKTFLAGMPGESTGGNLVINTRTFPDDAAGKLSLSLGYTSGLTGDDVAADPSDGGFDLFGFDDGSRAVPGGVRAIAALLSCEPCETELTTGQRRELNRVGAVQLMNDLELDTATATPKVSLGANYGDVYQLGGNEFGFFAAANYRNGWGQKESGISRTYRGGGEGFVFDNFTFEESSNTVDASGLLSMGLNVGDSSYQATTLLSRATESTVRVSEGTGGDSGAESVRYSIDWEERQFISQQFSGEHFIGGISGLAADWQVTASNARRYAPDRREVRFDLEGEDGVYDLLIANLSRTYEELSDDNLDASADLEYLFDNGLGDATVDFGVQFIHRERDADSESYGFSGNESAFDSNAPNLLVSDVVNMGNITGNPGTGLAFSNLTSPSQSYEAELDLNSVYASFSQRFASAYQAIIGLRYEDYQQVTDTFSVFGGGGPVQSKIDEGAVLPSLALNYEISDRQQVRFAASRTVSRPDFKETANSAFVDDQFNFRVRGNPLLKVSDVTNLDLRWEMYWNDTETVSVALFQKTIDNPIERVLLAASGTASNSRTFENGEEAELYGIELDGRKDFAFNDAATRSMFVALNTSLIDSEVELGGGETRRLQGQPEYTFNLVVGYDDFTGSTRHEVTALLNQSGETIVDVGVQGQADVVEEPRLALDLNYKWFLSDALTVKAKAGNLLDEVVQFTQGGRVYQEYRQGVTLEAGLDWNF